VKRTLALLLPLALLAQAPPRQSPGADSIKASDLRADLTFLASDALEGRMSLERGSEVAIQWIAAEFGKAGLQPLAGDSYLQPVPLVEYRPDRQLSALILKINGKTETLQVTGNYPNDGDYSGQVVFAGFGITAPELDYDDYAGIDARGKVVLVFNHEPQEDDAKSIFNGKGNTRYANARAKMMNAAHHGAVAVLVMPDPNHPKGMVRGPLDTPQQAPRTPRPIQAIADEASIPVFNINAKIGEELLKNPSEVQSKIDATLKPASISLSAEATLHVVNSLRKRQLSYNVIGFLIGSDPALSAETIIISAHYDHDGFAAGGGIYHGADDNGSGTVGVVALAKAFTKNPAKPKRTIMFAVYAAEERGLLGAYYYSPSPSPASDHKGRNQLRHDRPKRSPQHTDQWPDGNRPRYLQRAEYHRHQIQSRLSRRRSQIERICRPAFKLQMGRRHRPQRPVPQRPIPIPDARYSRHVVVHRLPPRLSPDHRHRRQNQLHQDGKDPETSLSDRLRFRRHKKSPKIPAPPTSLTTEPHPNRAPTVREGTALPRSSTE
jgi:hypothetical protein